MLFSSTIFLFVFLPFVLSVYFLILRKSIKLQNVFLLIVSLLFYAWGEPQFVFVMVLSIIFNYMFAIMLGRIRGERYRKICLGTAVLFNLSVLFVFKYLNFVIENVNNLFGREVFEQTNIALPIGISFFTFQALSYVIDVYRGSVKLQKNILYVALYISFFPQLIAGPIVRYSDIQDRLLDRRIELENIRSGVLRFIRGLGKKVIISNNMALIADAAFSTVSNGEKISIAFAWVGAIAYMMQIYFDFDGYSEMAIGLGKMFGFDFPENFNYPYISRSVTEFWRRWHISLSTWFRDYLYIPLGGNRVNSTGRHVFNLFVVWLATGIWHGANWTFVLWGILYFLFLVFEKYSVIFEKIKRMPNVFQSVYTLIIVVVAWVIFRADTILVAVRYILQMFGAGKELIDFKAMEYICEYKVFLIFSICYSSAIFKRINDRISGSLIGDVKEVLTPIMYMLVLGVSIAYLVTGSYNPFIYFNF